MRLKKEEFIINDQKAAKNFQESAEHHGVKRVIYLGGLGEKDDRMSPHLRSRREVGNILSQSSVPTIRVRAAIIVGAGSASYELMKSLTLNNRFIPFLPEFNSISQPVAIRDVVKYLVGIMETPGLESCVFQIGGKDVLPYKEMILRFAKILNRRIRFIDVSWVPIPVDWMCRLYAYWLHCFISIPVNITSLLLSSLKTDVVCVDNEISTILPFEPLDFVTAVKWVQEKEKSSRVFSHWSDVPPENMSDLLPLCQFEASEFVTDEHGIDIPATPEQVFPVICQIGGKHGWNHANILWEIRGLMRPFKGKGINSAIITGIYAARSIMRHGVSKNAFAENFYQDCHELTADLPYRRAVRVLTNLATRFKFMDHMIAVAAERPDFMKATFSSVSGHDPYKKIIMETAGLSLVFTFAQKILGHFVLRQQAHLPAKSASPAV